MFGFTKEQVQDFKTRYNKNQRKLATGIEIKPKGRPRKSTGDGPLCSIFDLIFNRTENRPLVFMPFALCLILFNLRQYIVNKPF